MNKMVLMAIKGNERKGRVKGTRKGTGQDGMTITKLSDNEKKNPCLHLIGVNRDSVLLNHRPRTINNKLMHSLYLYLLVR